mmetsp:Transcript_46863/g.85889  ORF Transcript_46863/g.85889 Transcript_46863/m.85889 type:complete len:452 (+) Transcript_46863:113-1468(+)
MSRSRSHGRRRERGRTRNELRSARGGAEGRSENGRHHYAAPSGHPQAAGYHAAWPGYPPAPHYGGCPQPPVRDYAQEKPEAYYAFLRHVGQGPEGYEIILSDRMCLDKHVADLTSCMESWLARQFGPPSVSGFPWRLGKLDLSRNALSDESLALVMDRLKRSQIRVLRLLLDANSAGTKAVTALSEYIWNNPEAVMEVGLADNDIQVSGSPKGDDCVSALLRCLYNHSAYPVKMRTEKGVQISPLTLRLNGNFSDDQLGPMNLLDRIRDKVGSDKVRFAKDAAPYIGQSEEFLSVYLPSFHDQRQRKIDREEESSPPAAEEERAPTPPRRRRKRRRRTEEDLPEPEPERKTDSEERDASPAASAEPEDEDAFGLSKVDKLVRNPDRRQRFEEEIRGQLHDLPDLASELAELAVCLIVTKHKPSMVAKELEGFIGDRSKEVTAWLQKYVRAL